ncbi:hypothetical protein TNCV_1655001 [Trichonephila clavipes]|nr:hypothetical protein TNCV_1655001 [Trichonephila clavipes]
MLPKFSENIWGGRGSQVVKVMDSCLACHEFKPSTAEDPPCRGGRCILNMSRPKRPPVSVEADHLVGTSAHAPQRPIVTYTKMGALLDSFWQQASSSNVNLGQVTKPAPPLLTSTPHQWEKAGALDRFNVHRSPTGWVFSSLELMTRRQRFRYLDH